jgi:hypothetical protein
MKTTVLLENESRPDNKILYEQLKSGIQIHEIQIAKLLLQYLDIEIHHKETQESIDGFK